MCNSWRHGELWVLKVVFLGHAHISMVSTCVYYLQRQADSCFYCFLLSSKPRKTVPQPLVAIKDQSLIPHSKGRQDSLRAVIHVCNVCRSFHCRRQAAEHCPELRQLQQHRQLRHNQLQEALGARARLWHVTPGRKASARHFWRSDLSQVFILLKLTQQTQLEAQG